ncbi:GNAT family N-acetyltransferase [Thalassospira sp.]|uniref:GNAT family N-acetyltransferase n=1 Tax=Thalassospira sp. TaxID=1912094 RepID=UPI002733C9DE|nr:GNAT family N-acetyltransferase [Thalassospira sp.]MDP2697265.1 GNAT family N-acetyltransferase [Thalassospira sp.]
MKDRIKHLGMTDFRTALDWAADEGWNPGLHDADAFFNADPEGFWGVFDRQGLAAVISAVRYGSQFGFVGFYICRPDRRGQGIGYRLWQAALAANDAATIGLDGVIDQQDNYRKSGFEFAHRNLRFGGVVIANAPKNHDLFTLDIADIGVIDAFEQTNRLFPEGRLPFLKGWLSAPDHVAIGLHGPMGVRGYGVLRPCRTGHKIGPLFAAYIDDARLVFHALLASRADQDGPVWLDIPEPNHHARMLVEDHGMVAEFETARMYRGPAPKLDLDMIYGISSFELG